MKYIMEIKPALEPKVRHQIQGCLEILGYCVSGGGQMTDGTVCDISFTDAETEQPGEQSGESYEREIMRLKAEVEQYKQVLKGYNAGA